VARKTLYIFLTVVVLASIFSCNKKVEHTAPAIRERDSVPMMVSYGVNTIISDSGVQKYRIVAERWEVNTTVSRQMWRFAKGLFLSEFNDKLEIILLIQADTAYYYNKERLWELRGRVRVNNIEGLKFTSQQLFWDQNSHELYSNVWSKLITPERTLEGDRFRSDEKMNKYNVWNTKGSFERGDVMKTDTAKNKNAQNDSLAPGLRDESRPRPKNMAPIVSHADTSKAGGRH